MKYKIEWSRGPFYSFIGVESIMNKHSEIRSFTGLRALALGGVILYHLYPHIVKGGYLGVVIFFCLSGYLLMYQHLEKGNREPLKKFKKQYLKLTPPLLTTIALTTLLSLLFFKSDFKDVAISGLSALLGVNNWQQILRGFSYFDLHGKFLPFTHLWAMSAQMQFYLIWAILRKLFGDDDQKFALSLAVTGIVSVLLMAGMKPFLNDTTRIYYGTDTRFFSFSAGALFGMIGYQGSFRKSQSDKTAPTIAALIAVLLAFFIFAEGSFLYYGGMFAFTLLICFVLSFVAKEDNTASQMLAHPVLRYLGLRSYELYLWQYPIMLIFQEIFSHAALPYTLSVIAQLPVLFILAEGTYRLFRHGAKIAATRISFVLFAVASIFGAVFIDAETSNPPTLASTDTPQEIKTAPDLSDKDPDEENVKEGGTIPEGVQAVNAQFPELALSAEDLEKLSKQPGLMIGDSITQMTALTLEQLLPSFTIDGKKNHQMVHATEVINSHDLSALPPEAPLVIQLGTNSDFNSAVLDELLSLTGERPVYFMNTSIPDPWEASVNKKFEEIAETRPNVHLIDWYGIAKPHSELFIKDHTHPKGLGMDLFAQTVAKNILSTKKEPKPEIKQTPSFFDFLIEDDREPVSP